jgi:hypothetical protein
MRLIIRWSAPSWHFQFAAAAAWRDRVRCVVLGHDDEIVPGDGIIALRCKRCRRRSPGWQLALGSFSHARVRPDRR